MVDNIYSATVSGVEFDKSKTYWLRGGLLGRWLGLILGHLLDNHGRFGLRFNGDGDLDGFGGLGGGGLN